jgi:hypothetical protein
VPNFGKKDQLRSIYDFKLFLLAEVLERDAQSLNPRVKKIKPETARLKRGFK